MTPTQKFGKHLPMFFLPVVWLLIGCGSFAANPPPLSEPEILATADAIRAMTPVAIPLPTRNECEFPDEDEALDCQARDEVILGEHNNEQRTREAEALIEIANEDATARVEDATADAIRNRRPNLQNEDIAATATEAFIDSIIATDQAMLAQWTKEAEALATATAEFFATVDASYDVAETAMAIRTEEALNQQRGCPGGCPTYPTWCEPPVKGNVSFNSGERIYHVWGDEFYEETKIDPAYGEYYFCTTDEAEAAGFRRAFN